MTPRETEIYTKFFNQYKKYSDKWIKRYGGKAEDIMNKRSHKIAKKLAENENKDKVREVIRKVLMTPPANPEPEEINSVDFISNVKPVEDSTLNSIKLSIPLLIRMMEYAKEDAKDDLDLHFAAENMIELAKDNKTLSMKDYAQIIHNQIREMLENKKTKLIK